MVKLAAFPKCFMDALCVDRSMTIFEWIEMASTLDVDGLEFDSGFVESLDEPTLEKVRRRCERRSSRCRCRATRLTSRLRIRAAAGGDCETKRDGRPHGSLRREICRVLSGQAYPDISRQQGVAWVVDRIRKCLEHAAKRSVVLIIENHYKDNYWRYPEFAQKREVFLEIVGQIDSPWFGVNPDPSNAIVVGKPPVLLKP